MVETILFEILNLASVVRPTLLYISLEAVIPAKAGIELKSLDSGSSPE